MSNWVDWSIMKYEADYIIGGGCCKSLSTRGGFFFCMTTKVLPSGKKVGSNWRGGYSSSFDINYDSLWYSPNLLARLIWWIVHDPLHFDIYRFEMFNRWCIDVLETWKKLSHDTVKESFLVELVTCHDSGRCRDGFETYLEEGATQLVYSVVM